VLEFISNELEESIRNSYKSPEQFIFTNVPRRRSSAIKYGIDHSALLSKSLAKRFSASYYQPLISKSKSQQKKTSGEERKYNASFKIKHGAKDLKGKTVIIIDDVVTTGASMGACAMLLKGLGAKKILGASISIAFKDKYTPFEFTWN
jgi:competence protein ComFC